MVATGLRGIDRRRDARVARGGRVVVHAHGGARGRVVDVSAGGTRIPRAEGAPCFTAGDRIWLDLHLDRKDASWLRLGGEVTRAGAHGAISVAFEHVPADFADRVQDELLAELEIGAASRILLVDANAARRRGRAVELRSSGCHVDEIATPLEALAALGANGAGRWLVAIADSVPAAIAEELRAYVAAAHPQVRVVSLGARS